MRNIRNQRLLPFLFVVSLLVCLSGCGSNSSISGNPPGGKPDHVQIVIDSFGLDQQKSPVTLTVASIVQQLYTTIYALPQMPEQVACTAEGGPSYTLTFYEGSKKLVTVLAEDEGCRQISLSGEQHVRTAMNNKDFWDQLNNAIYAATPAAQVDWLALIPAPSHTQPPQIAQIASATTAQQLYNAIVTLTPVTQNNAYLNGTPDYQLAFHTSDQPIAAALDLKQQLVSLGGQFHSRGGVYRMNEQFKQLFTKTLASVTFTRAQPDSLSLSLSTNQTGSMSPIRDTHLIQQLYTRIFTFPTAQPPPDNCLANDKVAGKQKLYELAFLQWNLKVLSVSAYEGSCTSVTRDFDTGQSQYLQADQQFWTLLHQAAGQ